MTLPGFVNLWFSLWMHRIKQNKIHRVFRSIVRRREVSPVYLLTSLKLLSRYSTLPILSFDAVGSPPPLGVLNGREKSSLHLNSCDFFFGAQKKVESDTSILKEARKNIVSVADPVYLLTSLKLLSRHSTFPTLLLDSLGRPPLAVLNDCEMTSLILNSFGF